MTTQELKTKLLEEFIVKMVDYRDKTISGMELETFLSSALSQIEDAEPFLK